MGLEELLAFALHALLLFEGALEVSGGLLLLAGQFGSDNTLDLLDPLWTHLILGVEGGDAILDTFQPDGWPGAVVGLGLLLEAHEVLVGAASASVLGEDQSRAASRAVDGATQIMRVNPVFLAGVVVGGEYILDGEPDLGFDQGGVFAFVVDALVAHDAHVVGIGEQVVHGRKPDRAAGTGGGGSAGEAFGLSGQGEISATPFTRCVLLEAPADDLRPLGVKLDPRVLDAVSGLAPVEVAEWCPEGCAAFFGLAHEAVHDFEGQVAGVELGDLSHEAVEKFAAWGLVDVLAA